MTALASWGLLLPLTIAGLLSVMSRDLPVAPMAVGTAILLLAAVARGQLGWSLGGNATLLHQGRVWPPAHLIASVFAGVAIIKMSSIGVGVYRLLALLVTFGIFVIGSISPILAWAGLIETMTERGGGFVYSGPDLAAGSFIRRASKALTPDDVVLLRGADELGFYLFQFSGCRLAEYDDQRLSDNDLRIRYHDLARKWDEQMAAGRFEPTHVVLPSSSHTDGEPVAQGWFEGGRWILVDLQGPGRDPSAPSSLDASVRNT